jgi:hypothetical protein
VRLETFDCGECGQRFEKAIPRGWKSKAHHCGRPAKRVIGAPAITNTVARFSHAIGREATFREIDRKLAKDGSYIPSAKEAKEVREMTENKVLPEYFGPPPDDRKIKKAVDQAWAAMKQGKQPKRNLPLDAK